VGIHQYKGLKLQCLFMEDNKLKEGINMEKKVINHLIQHGQLKIKYIEIKK